MKKILLFSCISIGMVAAFGQSACSQEEFVSGPARLMTRFSFVQLTGGVILLRAGFDNITDSLNFILDTGSGGISLDSQTVQELNIPNIPSDRTIRGIAGMRTVNFAYNHTLHLPGLSIDSLNFHINNYDLLSAVYGVKIDGIIGYSFLSRYIVRIDYDKLEIEVFTQGTYKYPKGGYMLQPVIAGGGLPMQYAELNESRRLMTRFFLDTGAGICLLFSEEFCKDSALLQSSKRKRYKTVTEGLGGRKEMEITILKAFRLGPYKFKKIPVYLFDDEYNVTAYPYLAGLIGNDLLRRFNIVINYQSKEFHLLPNTHIREQFDYSYSGLGLYAVEDQIVIFDVVPGSPADQAGLKVDDIVIGMNNDISGNMQAYKTMLQLAGSKIRMIIKRKNELMEMKLSVKSIL